MALAVVALGVSAGCSEEPWPRVVPAPAPPVPPEVIAPGGGGVAESPPVRVDPKQLELDEETVGVLRGVLDEYDKVHKALTGDTVDGVALAGVAMAEGAQRARAAVKDQTVAAWLVEVEARGRTLGEGDIEKVRLTYGELSKALIGVVSAVAGLREGRVVFECPMAKGYQKWIQREPNLRNPYFGASMLVCGDESRWTP